MQTFLPYSSFERSAECLDSKRLGKQRVEAFTLLKVIVNPERKGWRNHPAFKIWEEHGIALVVYGMDMCTEWKRRGYVDNLYYEFEYLAKDIKDRNIEMPDIIGYEPYHASHRSNLLRKDPIYYGQFGWKEPSNLPYVWRIENDTCTEKNLPAIE